MFRNFCFFILLTSLIVACGKKEEDLVTPTPDATEQVADQADDINNVGGIGGEAKVAAYTPGTEGSEERTQNSISLLRTYGGLVEEVPAEETARWSGDTLTNTSTVLVQDFTGNYSVNVLDKNAAKGRGRCGDLIHPMSSSFMSAGYTSADIIRRDVNNSENGFSGSEYILSIYNRGTDSNPDYRLAVRIGNSTRVIKLSCTPLGEFDPRPRIILARADGSYAGRSIFHLTFNEMEKLGLPSDMLGIVFYEGTVGLGYDFLVASALKQAALVAEGVSGQPAGSIQDLTNYPQFSVGGQLVTHLHYVEAGTSQTGNPFDSLSVTLKNVLEVSSNYVLMSGQPSVRDTSGNIIPNAVDGTWKWTRTIQYVGTCQGTVDYLDITNLAEATNLDGSPKQVFHNGPLNRLPFGVNVNFQSGTSSAEDCP